MAQIPTFSRFTQEDFKDLPNKEKLLPNLNSFMGAVVAALTQRLTFRENLAAQTLEMVFLESSDIYPIRFKWNFPTKPTDLWITNIQAVDGGTDPTACGCLWSYDDQGIIVSKIFGLTTSHKYRVRIKALAD